jgi:hypothetical protein
MKDVELLAFLCKSARGKQWFEGPSGRPSEGPSKKKGLQSALQERAKVLRGCGKIQFVQELNRLRKASAVYAEIAKTSLRG